jgi:putative ABC transport system permease protein
MDYSENIRLAIGGLVEHRIRSFLTMLGIIFGVASVIAMLSIGEGAKREAIAKYQDLGVNNIIIREKKLSEAELEEVRAKFSQGLSIKDANAILEIVPGITKIASQAEINTEVKYSDKSVKSNIIGVTSNYLGMMNYKINRGEMINDHHYNMKLKVCILGAGVSGTLFGYDDPVGKMVKVEDQWLEVIGVLES